MNHKITIFILVFLLGTGYCGSYAQQSVVSASNNASGVGGFVSYTIGQVAYLNIAGNDGMISEGVQQPFEILLIEGIEEGKGIALECTVYPNPSAGLLRLKIEDHDIKSLTYQLYNPSGVLMQSEKIIQNEMVISLEDLKPGYYFISVSEHEKTLRTFKVIKK